MKVCLPNGEPISLFVFWQAKGPGGAGMASVLVAPILLYRGEPLFSHAQTRVSYGLSRSVVPAALSDPRRRRR